MKPASRLLVLVEDTTATRDLWPVWRQKALEPVLEKIETASFGAYEMNLVTFASVDGQSDGMLRSGAWTQSAQRFREYCDFLTFSGSNSGSALGEALAEATHLSYLPSPLGKRENIVHHLLLCLTGTMGRLPVPWPFREQNINFEIRCHALTMLGYMVTTHAFSISIVTEQSSNGVLCKRFGSLAGPLALRACEDLSEGRQYLALIHPRWRHGYQALFPESKISEDWVEGPISDSEDHSCKTCTPLPLSPSPRREVPVKPERNLVPSVGVLEGLSSFKMKQHFPDAVCLSTWNRVGETAKIGWNEEGDVTGAVTEVGSLESELALERDLLNLETGQDTSRDISSANGSKMDSSASYGCVPSPAHSSTKETHPAIDVTGPFARTDAQTAGLPEDGTSSVTSQRVAIASQRNKSLSSSTSFSSEAVRKPNDMVTKRPTPGSRSGMEVRETRSGPHFRTWPISQSLEGRHTLTVRGSYTQTEDSPPFPAQALTDDDRSLLSHQGQDFHEPKRLRSKYDLNKAKSPSQLSLHWQDRDGLSPMLQPQQQASWGIEPFRNTASLIRPPQRTLMPSSDFGWNVEWSGPLYLSCPWSKESAPQKLFDIEILCKRTLSFTSMWPNELIVRPLDRKRGQSCPMSCLISPNWRSMTEIGRAFGKQLTEGKMIAIVDLLGEQSTQLILSGQDNSSNGNCQIVAGFQRGVERT